MLVGLRWWSQINEEGLEEWIFESMGDEWVQNAVDSKVFWMGLYATFGVWLVFACLAIFSLHVTSLSISSIGAMLTFINLMGY